MGDMRVLEADHEAAEFRQTEPLRHLAFEHAALAVAAPAFSGDHQHQANLSRALAERRKCSSVEWACACVRPCRSSLASIASLPRATCARRRRPSGASEGGAGSGCAVRCRGGAPGGRRGRGGRGAQRLRRPPAAAAGWPATARSSAAKVFHSTRSSRDRTRRRLRSRALVSREPMAPGPFRAAAWAAGFFAAWRRKRAGDGGRLAFGHRLLHGDLLRPRTRQRNGRAVSIRLAVRRQVLRHQHDEIAELLDAAGNVGGMPRRGRNKCRRAPRRLIAPPVSCATIRCWKGSSGASALMGNLASIQIGMP